MFSSSVAPGECCDSEQLLLFDTKRKPRQTQSCREPRRHRKSSADLLYCMQTRMAVDEEEGGTSETSEDSNFEETAAIFVSTERPALTQEEFHKLYGLEDGKLSGERMYKDSWGSMSRSLRRWARKWKTLTFMRLMRMLMPILRWLPNYNWKRDFPDDCAAGFTVGKQFLKHNPAENS